MSLNGLQKEKKKNPFLEHCGKHPPDDGESHSRFYVLVIKPVSENIWIWWASNGKRSLSSIYLFKIANLKMYLEMLGVYCIGCTTQAYLEDLPVVPDRTRRSESLAPPRSPVGLWTAARSGCGSEPWSLLQMKSHLLEKKTIMLCMGKFTCKSVDYWFSYWVKEVRWLW